MLSSILRYCIQRSTLVHFRRSSGRLFSIPREIIPVQHSFPSIVPVRLLTVKFIDGCTDPVLIRSTEKTRNHRLFREFGADNFLIVRFENARSSCSESEFLDCVFRYCNNGITLGDNQLWSFCFAKYGEESAIFVRQCSRLNEEWRLQFGGAQESNAELIREWHIPSDYNKDMSIWKYQSRFDITQSKTTVVGNVVNRVGAVGADLYRNELFERTHLPLPEFQVIEVPDIYNHNSVLMTDGCGSVSTDVMQAICSGMMTSVASNIVPCGSYQYGHPLPKPRVGDLAKMLLKMKDYYNLTDIEFTFAKKMISLNFGSRINRRRRPYNFSFNRWNKRWSRINLSLQSIISDVVDDIVLFNEDQEGHKIPVPFSPVEEKGDPSISERTWTFELAANALLQCKTPEDELVLRRELLADGIDSSVACRRSSQVLVTRVLSSPRGWVDAMTEADAFNRSVVLKEAKLSRKTLSDGFVNFTDSLFYLHRLREERLRIRSELAKSEGEIVHSASKLLYERKVKSLAVLPSSSNGGSRRPLSRSSEGKSDRSKEVCPVDRFLAPRSVSLWHAKLPVQAWSALTIPRSSSAFPAAAQGRLGGYKGLWLLDPSLPPRTVSVRPSMKKVNQGMDILKSSDSPKSIKRDLVDVVASSMPYNDPPTALLNSLMPDALSVSCLSSKSKITEERSRNLTEKLRGRDERLMEAQARAFLEYGRLHGVSRKFTSLTEAWEQISHPNHEQGRQKLPESETVSFGDRTVLMESISNVELPPPIGSFSSKMTVTDNSNVTDECTPSQEERKISDDLISVEFESLLEEMKPGLPALSLPLQSPHATQRNKPNITNAAYLEVLDDSEQMHRGTKTLWNGSIISSVYIPESMVDPRTGRVVSTGRAADRYLNYLFSPSPLTTVPWRAGSPVSDRIELASDKVAFSDLGLGRNRSNCQSHLEIIKTSRPNRSAVVGEQLLGLLTSLGVPPRVFEAISRDTFRHVDRLGTDKEFTLDSCDPNSNSEIERTAALLVSNPEWYSSPSSSVFFLRLRMYLRVLLGDTVNWRSSRLLEGLKAAISVSNPSISPVDVIGKCTNVSKLPLPTLPIPSPAYSITSSGEIDSPVNTELLSISREAMNTDIGDVFSDPYLNPLEKNIQLTETIIQSRAQAIDEVVYRGASLSIISANSTVGGTSDIDKRGGNLEGVLGISVPLNPLNPVDDSHFPKKNPGLFVEEARSSFIAPDPTGLLRPGEVFFRPARLKSSVMSHIPGSRSDPLGNPKSLGYEGRRALTQANSIRQKQLRFRAKRADSFIFPRFPRRVGLIRDVSVERISKSQIIYGKSFEEARGHHKKLIYLHFYRRILDACVSGLPRCGPGFQDFMTRLSREFSVKIQEKVPRWALIRRITSVGAWSAYSRRERIRQFWQSPGLQVSEFLGASSVGSEGTEHALASLEQSNTLDSFYSGNVLESDAFDFDESMLEGRFRIIAERLKTLLAESSVLRTRAPGAPMPSFAMVGSGPLPPKSGVLRERLGGDEFVLEDIGSIAASGYFSHFLSLCQPSRSEAKGILPMNEIAYDSLWGFRFSSSDPGVSHHSSFKNEADSPVGVVILEPAVLETRLRKNVKLRLTRAVESLAEEYEETLHQLSPPFLSTDLREDGSKEKVPALLDSQRLARLSRKPSECLSSIFHADLALSLGLSLPDRYSGRGSAFHTFQRTSPATNWVAIRNSSLSKRDSYSTSQLEQQDVENTFNEVASTVLIPPMSNSGVSYTRIQQEKDLNTMMVLSGVNSLKPSKILGPSGKYEFVNLSHSSNLFELEEKKRLSALQEDYKLRRLRSVRVGPGVSLKDISKSMKIFSSGNKFPLRVNGVVVNRYGSGSMIAPLRDFSATLIREVVLATRGQNHTGSNFEDQKVIAENQALLTLKNSLNADHLIPFNEALNSEIRGFQEREVTAKEEMRVSSAASLTERNMRKAGEMNKSRRITNKIRDLLYRKYYSLLETDSVSVESVHDKVDSVVNELRSTCRLLETVRSEPDPWKASARARGYRHMSTGLYQPASLRRKSSLLSLRQQRPTLIQCLVMRRGIIDHRIVPQNSQYFLMRIRNNRRRKFLAATQNRSAEKKQSSNLLLPTLPPLPQLPEINKRFNFEDSIEGPVDTHIIRPLTEDSPASVVNSYSSKKQEFERYNGMKFRPLHEVISILRRRNKGKNLRKCEKNERPSLSVPTSFPSHKHSSEQLSLPSLPSSPLTSYGEGADSIRRLSTGLNSLPDLSTISSSSSYMEKSTIDSDEVEEGKTRLSHFKSNPLTDFSVMTPPRVVLDTLMSRAGMEIPDKGHLTLNRSIFPQERDPSLSSLIHPRVHFPSINRFTIQTKWRGIRAAILKYRRSAEFDISNIRELLRDYKGLPVHFPNELTPNKPMRLNLTNEFMEELVSMNSSSLFSSVQYSSTSSLDSLLCWRSLLGIDGQLSKKPDNVLGSDEDLVNMVSEDILKKSNLKDVLLVESSDGSKISWEAKESSVSHPLLQDVLPSEPDIIMPPSECHALPTSWHDTPYFPLFVAYTDIMQSASLNSCLKPTIYSDSITRARKLSLFEMKVETAPSDLDNLSETLTAVTSHIGTLPRIPDLQMASNPSIPDMVGPSNRNALVKSIDPLLVDSPSAKSSKLAMQQLREFNNSRKFSLGDEHFLSIALSFDVGQCDSVGGLSEDSLSNPTGITSASIRGPVLISRAPLYTTDGILVMRAVSLYECLLREEQRFANQGFSSSQCVELTLKSLSSSCRTSIDRLRILELEFNRLVQTLYVGTSPTVENDAQLTTSGGAAVLGDGLIIPPALLAAFHSLASMEGAFSLRERLRLFSDIVENERDSTLRNKLICLIESLPSATSMPKSKKPSDISGASSVKSRRKSVTPRWGSSRSFGFLWLLSLSRRPPLESSLERIRMHAVVLSFEASTQEVALLPIRGVESAAARMSGGDYDGDIAFVTWNARLVRAVAAAKGLQSLYRYWNRNGILVDETAVPAFINEEIKRKFGDNSQSSDVSKSDKKPHTASHRIDMTKNQEEIRILTRFCKLLISHRHLFFSKSILATFSSTLPKQLAKSVPQDVNFSVYKDPLERFVSSEPSVDISESRLVLVNPTDSSSCISEEGSWKSHLMPRISSSFDVREFIDATGDEQLREVFLITPPAAFISDFVSPSTLSEVDGKEEFSVRVPDLSLRAGMLLGEVAPFEVDETSALLRMVHVYAPSTGSGTVDHINVLRRFRIPEVVLRAQPAGTPAAHLVQMLALGDSIDSALNKIHSVGKVPLESNKLVSDSTNEESVSSFSHISHFEVPHTPPSALIMENSGPTEIDERIPNLALNDIRTLVSVLRNQHVEDIPLNKIMTEPSSKLGNSESKYSQVRGENVDDIHASTFHLDGLIAEEKLGEMSPGDRALERYHAVWWVLEYSRRYQDAIDVESGASALRQKIIALFSAFKKFLGSSDGPFEVIKQDGRNMLHARLEPQEALSMSDEELELLFSQYFPLESLISIHNSSENRKPNGSTVIVKTSGKDKTDRILGATLRLPETPRRLIQCSDLRTNLESFDALLDIRRVPSSSSHNSGNRFNPYEFFMGDYIGPLVPPIFSSFSSCLETSMKELSKKLHSEGFKVADESVLSPFPAMNNSTMRLTQLWIYSRTDYDLNNVSISHRFVQNCLLHERAYLSDIMRSREVLDPILRLHGISAVELFSSLRKTHPIVDTPLLRTLKNLCDSYVDRQKQGKPLVGFPKSKLFLADSIASIDSVSTNVRRKAKLPRFLRFLTKLRDDPVLLHSYAYDFSVVANSYGAASRDSNLSSSSVENNLRQQINVALKKGGNPMSKRALWKLFRRYESQESTQIAHSREEALREVRNAASESQREVVSKINKQFEIEDLNGYLSKEVTTNCSAEKKCTS